MPWGGYLLWCVGCTWVWGPLVPWLWCSPRVGCCVEGILGSYWVPLGMGLSLVGVVVTGLGVFVLGWCVVGMWKSCCLGLLALGSGRAASVGPMGPGSLALPMVDLLCVALMERVRVQVVVGQAAVAHVYGVPVGALDIEA